MERPRIVIIGAGNVATHLAKALDQVYDVVAVCSRHLSSAKALSQKLRLCKSADKIDSLPIDSDFYLIAVNDDAIVKVAASLPKVSGIVMHTSGSVGLEALSCIDGPKGVFYPLQTFSKDVPVNIKEVPFFIEGCDPQTTEKIIKLATGISDIVHQADSQQRATLHIAAVFGCNFFNHLLDISSQILKESGYTLEVLKPLLQVTLDKAMSIDPHKAQTGPAVRHDRGIINKHLSMLDGYPKEIYATISEAIMHSHPNTI